MQGRRKRKSSTEERSPRGVDPAGENATKFPRLSAHQKKKSSRALAREDFECRKRTKLLLRIVGWLCFSSWSRSRCLVNGGAGFSAVLSTRRPDCSAGTRS